MFGFVFPNKIASSSISNNNSCRQISAGTATNGRSSKLCFPNYRLNTALAVWGRNHGYRREWNWTCDRRVFYHCQSQKSPNPAQADKLCSKTHSNSFFAFPALRQLGGAAGENGDVLADAKRNQRLEFGLLLVGIRVRVRGHHPNAVLANSCRQLLKVCQ